MAAAWEMGLWIVIVILILMVDLWIGVGHHENISRIAQ